jgi:hypothetical protein
VDVTLTAEDGHGSGVARVEYSLDGGAWTQYAGPLQVSESGQHALQFRATDVAGNVEEAQTATFRVDTTPPAVNVVSPADGSSYRLGSKQVVRFKCTDDESGVASCAGTVDNGAPLDTSAIGEHGLTVTSTDNVGNAASVTARYRVVYAWNGFFAPTKNTDDKALNVLHAGDLVKLSFALDGDRGPDVLAPGFPNSVAIAAPHWPRNELKPTQGRPGLVFEEASGRYAFYWQTDRKWAGTTRRFQIRLADGSETLHTADFAFVE